MRSFRAKPYENAKLYLGELTWVDVEEFLKKHQTVIVPVGSCEQHGPHLPLDTDAYDAFWLSMKAAEKAQCALVAPPIYCGVSSHHMDFRANSL